MAKDKREHPISSLEAQIGKLSLERGCFKKLVQKGCDKEKLLFLLSTVKEGPPLDMFVFGEQTDDDISFLKQKCQELSKEIQRLHRTNGFILMMPYFQKRQRYWIHHLPGLLNTYATELETSIIPALKLTSRKKNHYGRLLKARLISYVKQRTGRFHDKQVALLIALVTRNKNYHQTAHKEWRRRNLPGLTPLLPKY